MPTTVWNGRITKQGLRDLNYYGPRPAKGVAEASVAAPVANEEIAPETPAPVTAAVEAPDEDAGK